MPIVHILQTPGELQTQRIEVWCKNKKCEYRYVAVAVSDHRFDSKKKIVLLKRANREQ